MLEKEQTSPWFQHAMDLCQRLRGVWDATHGECAHDRVERTVRHRQLFGCNQPLFDGNRSGGDSSFYDAVHAGIRVHRRDLPNLSRIILQVDLRAETDFQHFAARVRQ